MKKTKKPNLLNYWQAFLYFQSVAKFFAELLNYLAIRSALSLLSMVNCAWGLNEIRIDCQDQKSPDGRVILDLPSLCNYYEFKRIN